MKPSKKLGNMRKNLYPISNPLVIERKGAKVLQELLGHQKLVTKYQCPDKVKVTPSTSLLKNKYWPFVKTSGHSELLLRPIGLPINRYLVSNHERVGAMWFNVSIVTVS